MDALAVKQATAFAKAYVVENGPLVMEMVRPAFNMLLLQDNAVKLLLQRPRRCFLCCLGPAPSHSRTLALLSKAGALRMRIESSGEVLSGLSCRTHTATTVTPSRTRAAPTARATRSRASGARRLSPVLHTHACSPVLHLHAPTKCSVPPSMLEIQTCFGQCAIRTGVL